MPTLHAREFIVAVLAAFGVILPPEAFLSGLFLAAAGAYLMTIFVPEKKPVELRWMLLLALFVATCIALAHDRFLAEWPIQLKMAIGGALSRWIVRIIANKAEERAKGIASPDVPDILEMGPETGAEKEEMT